MEIYRIILKYMAVYENLWQALDIYKKSTKLYGNLWKSI